MTLMTYDPDQRLLFSPRIMPLLCLYRRVLSFPGDYVFSSILRPGCLAFPKTLQSLQLPTRKENEKLTPQLTGSITLLPLLFFFCVYYILYPPYTKPTSRCTP